MSYYRVYLLNSERRVRAAESFLSENDKAACEEAALLLGFCDDIFAGFELWRGPRCISVETGARQSSVLPSWEDIGHARQELVIQLEIRMQRTFAAVRESQKLLAMSSEICGPFPYRSASRRSHPQMR
jgi:hypothetical protein